MKQTQAVGIDLGTTYSCIAWLNEHGHPVTIPNQEGELSTPSVVFFDGTKPIVGTEALRNAIAHPDQVVQNAKRHMGEKKRTWAAGGVKYSPVNVSSLILRKLISAAQERIGEITEAVVTVPAQFSDAQRHATISAGLSAGLEKVEVINEPVAAALCHVLGNEGLAFTELAIDQQVLVYDLGGGTLDLAVVHYSSDEVRVVASDGDLELGGLDWTQVLVDIAADKFIQEFKDDPRKDPESHQFLALEAEQAKRSLSVRPKAAITVQHGGNRKTYQIEQEEFEYLSRKLLARADGVTRRILADNGFGWAHVDVVLTTGGASRMPMVKGALKKLSGRTLNSSLSPDQSIAHGAAYYAGMLLANKRHTRTVFSSQAYTRLAKLSQQSVNARGLGILIRDTKTGSLIPHYLIPPNTALPASRTHVFGTVVDRQTKVHIQIAESGAGPGKPHTVLGDCQISDLPDNLPEGSEVEVTISYDRQARVHVSARELKSENSAEAEIIRQENISPQLQQEIERGPSPPRRKKKKPVVKKKDDKKSSLTAEWATFAADMDDLTAFVEQPSVEDAEQPVPLCNVCGEVLNARGICESCRAKLPVSKVSKKQNAKPEDRKFDASRGPLRGEEPTIIQPPEKKKKTKKKKKRASSAEDEFWELVD